MKFRELKLFERDEYSETISRRAIEALELPIPSDVLEQFVLDHGLKPAFQEWYADLDLHKVSWSLESLSIDEIRHCSSKYDSYVAGIAEKHTNAQSLSEATYADEAINSWQCNGTWPRPPVFLFNVPEIPHTHHLVEGHTRVGALLGLTNNHNLVRINSHHDCWVGRPGHHNDSGAWKIVRQEHPLSFKIWLYDAIGEKDAKGKIASELFDAEHRHRHEISIGNTHHELKRLIAYDQNISINAEQLQDMEEHWCHELEL